MSSHDLKRATDQTLDAIAANRAQHRLLFNPSPQVDSLAEHLIALRAFGVPPELLRVLMENVRELIRLNAGEHRDQRAVAGTLDALTRAEHAAERAGRRVASELTIRCLVRRLRPDLDVVGGGVGGTDYALACVRVREVCELVPAEKLRSASLRHELGGRRHDLLLEVLRSVEL